MPRGWGPVALAVLVVLAGCSGFGPDRDRERSPDRTPFSVPERSSGGGPDWSLGDEGDRPGDVAGAVPRVDEPRCSVGGNAGAQNPGLTDDFLASGSWIESAHERGLSGCSYRATMNRTVRAHNGSVVRATWIRASFDDEGERYVVRRKHLRRDATLSFLIWSDGGGVHRVHVEREGRHGLRGSHVIGPPTDDESELAGADVAKQSFRSLVRRALAGTEIVHTEDAPGPDMPARYMVVAEGTIPDPLVPRGFEDVSNVSAQVVLDAWGVIRRLHLRYDARLDGQPVTVRTTFRLEAVGNATVEVPREPGPG